MLLRVAEHVVARDELDQRGLARTVAAMHHPLLTLAHQPTQPAVKHDVRAVRHAQVAKVNQRLARRHSRRATSHSTRTRRRLRTARRRRRGHHPLLLALRIEVAGKPRRHRLPRPRVPGRAPLALAEQ